MDVTPDRLIALATAKPTTPPPMTTQGTFSIKLTNKTVTCTNTAAGRRDEV